MESTIQDNQARIQEFEGLLEQYKNLGPEEFKAEEARFIGLRERAEKSLAEF